MYCASMGFGEERAYGGHFATPVFGRRAVRQSRRRSHRSRVIGLPALVEPGVRSLQDSVQVKGSYLSSFDQMTPEPD